MTAERDIVYETKNHWVRKTPKGFEVYRTGLVCSTRVAVVGYRGAKGVAKAIAEAERREGAARR